MALFSKKIKPYKLSARFIKNVGATVFSLGFPASEAEKGKLAFDIISEKLGAEKFDAGSDKVTFSLKENLKQGFAQNRNKKKLENLYRYFINSR